MKLGKERERGHGTVVRGKSDHGVEGGGGEIRNREGGVAVDRKAIGWRGRLAGDVGVGAIEAPLDKTSGGGGGGGVLCQQQSYSF